jgi:tetratricopeptide (TPR) repeat protein
MSLTGNLKTMSLPDILQWISMGQKTGTLHVERRSVQKRIVVRGGKIFSSWSNDPRESLGQFLIRERLVTEEQLFKALLAQEEKGQLLGSILTSEGLLEEEDLRLALHAKATETIYDLFLWPEGQFQFKEGEFPHDVLISFEMPVTPVILEGMRRVDEWARIREVFPTMDTTLKVKGPSHAVEDALERQALGLVAAGKTLAEMSLEMRRSEFDTADLAFRLYQRGLVAADQTREAAKAPDPIGAIQALLGLAYQRLQEKRYDAAIKAYEEVLALDRLNQHAKKGLIATIESRSREKAVRSVPLTKVPVLSMDLIALTKEDFDPHEGFVLSRVNGEWDVQSILKLCPMGEEAALLIFSRLLERKAITLRDPQGTKGAVATNDGR